MHKITGARIRLLRALDRTLALADKNSMYYLEERRALARIVDHIKRDERGDYVSLSLDDPSRIAFADIPEKKYSKQRVKTTFGRYVRRRIGMDCITLPDRILSDFMSRTFRCSGDISQYIKIVKGKDIQNAYAEQWGGYSCMTGEAAIYTELYALNPDKVSMVKYEGETGKYQYRALLWKTDQGNKYLDRIYPSDGSTHYYAILAWAQKKGYMVERDKQNPQTVTLKHKNTFPYMDTFTYGKMISCDTVMLCNHHIMNGVSMPDAFDFTDGGYSGDARVNCNQCDRMMHEDNVYYSDDDGNYCENCYSEYFFTCEYCGETAHNDGAAYVDGDYWCQYCAETHAIQCDWCGHYITEESAKYAVDTERSYCNSCAKHKLWQCYECGDYFEEVIDDQETQESFCEECYETFQEEKAEV